ncbi:hypothetical protein B9Z55_027705 [Caenorhabditis nigoni]|uniref:Morc S5 domain-containing protein n=1 Tax=Caenorhabditis nigoni TaxID=1611254 RepID=A0A2G5SET8_9PELO|nr:hypothetical protein B9Z55_027705 [Caenorhabditis nigoni]
MNESSESDVRGKECLEKASLDRRLLKANSHNHSSGLSAIAEILDNCYDANATKVFISLVYHLFISFTGPEINQLKVKVFRASNLHFSEDEFPNNQLRIYDNGTGLSRQEVLNITKLGFCEKSEGAIGRYGTGLKSAGFHLGKKILLLTKKDGIYTALFMVWDKLENQNDESMLVATPSYNGSTYQKYCPEPEDERVHDYEVRLIHENMALNGNLFDEFSRIPFEHGTLIIIKDLQRTKVGYEQLLDASIGDIREKGEDLPPHKTSLVEYLKVLYLTSKIFFFVQHELQTHRKIVSTWVGRCYSNVVTFGTESLKAATEELKREVVNLDDEHKRLQSENAQENIREMPKEERAISKNRLCLAMAKVAEKKKEIQLRIKFNQKIGNHNTHFEFGLEVNDRQNNGIHFYANDRLILYGYKSPFFEKCSNSLGISMYCNLDANLFPPTQNKENFLYDKDFNSIVRLCDKNLNQYYRYLMDVWIPRHMKNQWGRDMRGEGEDDVWSTFWMVYGYPTSSPDCQKTPDYAKRTNIIEKECGIWKVCGPCRLVEKLEASSNGSSTGKHEEPRRDSQLRSSSRKSGRSLESRQHSEERFSSSDSEIVVLAVKKNKDERRETNREASRRSQLIEIVEEDGANDIDSDPIYNSRRHERDRRHETEERAPRRRGTDDDVELVSVKKKRTEPDVTTTVSAEASAAVALEKVLRALGVDPTPQLNTTRVIIDKIQKPRQARRLLRADATIILRHLEKNKRHRVNMRAINKEKTIRAKLESFVDQIN